MSKIRAAAAAALAGLAAAGCATQGVYTHPFDTTVNGVRIVGQIEAGENRAALEVALSGRLPLSNETVAVTVAPDGTVEVHLRLVVQ